MIPKNNEEALLYSIANNLPVNDKFQPKTTSEALLAQIAKNGGGGGVQPDLSQNDPNAPDFVKNRTHYEGFATIIEEREVRAWFDGTGVAVSRIPQVGEKLTITFNGETYKCTAWESYGRVGLGNGGAYGIKEGENVPFFAGFGENDEEGTGAFISTTTIGENTISIVDDSGNSLLEETFNVEINVDEPCYSPDIPLDQPLIVGNTYKVVYDGVPYECVAWNSGDYICLGNGEIDGFEHSEDVPFVIGTYQGDSEWFWYLAFYGSDSHAVSVSGNIIRKLDEKYLPDRVMDAIKNAWTKAETAQTTAETAQTTAEKQADWNESDKDAVGFVKNRTHYKTAVMSETFGEYPQMTFYGYETSSESLDLFNALWYFGEHCYFSKTMPNHPTVKTINDNLKRCTAYIGRHYVVIDVRWDTHTITYKLRDISDGVTVSSDFFYPIVEFEYQRLDANYLPKVSDLDATWLAELKEALGI